MQDSDLHPTAPDKAAEAYHRIKAALYRHRHRPGAFLNIRVLAAKMRVSPTPVREALIRLADEDIIGFTRGRGYVAKALDLEEVAGDYEMALTMARLAIERDPSAPFEGVSDLRPDFATDERGLDEAEASLAASYVENLYDRIAILSGNVRLIRNMRQFSDRTTHIRQFGLMSAPPFFSLVNRMSMFEDAMIAGNRTAAIAILDDQIRRKIGGLQDLIKELNLRAQQARVPLEDLL
ncbi:Transcriptional regulator, GntR family [Neorhizobium galegae bv. orientalis]|nr:Transcriptional regulator, GntR family [Neorhizobium galegae bv. orientalis]